MIVLERVVLGCVGINPHSILSLSFLVCHAVGAIVGIAVGATVLVAAIVAAVVYGIKCRRKLPAAPTAPTAFDAQRNAAKPTEAAAAVPLVATAETVLPGEAAGAKSEVTLTQVRRFEESGTVPKAASMEGPQAV